MIRHSADPTLRASPSHDPCAAADDGFAALASRLARWAQSLATPADNGQAGCPREPQAAVVGVCPCTAGEGGTSTLGRLAVAAAAVFPRGVLVVESQADGAARPDSAPNRWPLQPAATFGSDLPQSPPWLTDDKQQLQGVSIQRGQIQREHIQHTGDSDVWLLRASDALGSPLDAGALWAALQPLRASYGLMLVGLPAAGEWAHTSALAAMLDGVLLVIEAERTQARVAQRVKEYLESLGARLLGVVLSGARQHLPPWLDRRLP
jgi:Mrp family chromosome partitioning ATPase